MKAYTSRVPENQSKINCLIVELRHMQSRGEPKCLVNMKRRDIWNAKQRDRKGQMA